MKSKTAPSVPTFLGIEGGGTRTVALLADANGKLLRRLELGAANLRLLTDAQLLKHFRVIRRTLPVPSALCVGLAGMRTENDRKRILRTAELVWPRVPCHATNDLETALAAAEPAQHSTFNIQRSTLNSPSARVLVLSGTGSCFFGRAADGRTAKFGGWGHLLGDKGSGYEIALRALKAVVFYLDSVGEWSRLGKNILRALSLNEPNDLSPWVVAASKSDIAALAPEVFQAAAHGDTIARDILAGAASSLAKDAVSCARKLFKVQGSKFKVRGSRAPVEFVLAGSVLLRQPKFAARVAAHLRQAWPGAIVTPLARESAWGAVALAQAGVGTGRRPVRALKGRKTISGITSPNTTASDVSSAPAGAGTSRRLVPTSCELSPTERRHPRSMNLDRLSLTEAIVLMLREDEKIPVAVLGERKSIERAIRLIVRAFKRGGRLFYVGAGTSGRLGVLDASECPPTFRTDPEMVQGIIAGGARALTTAVEGAEDDYDAGGRAVEFRGAGRRDVVVGIAASGRTPFVWGALAAAKRRGAATVLVCFNPHLEISRAQKPDVVIAPDFGPEILTGSTRLKAGTATKLILNLFTTLAMVRLGKVVGNLMVDLNPSNVKLRDRAVRIVRELTGADEERAQTTLVKSKWVVKQAVARLGRR
ncbi:MAG: N-acetylmuramic acid 6-phosphate etherase [Verrucomicrobia bacterium]|nr:N-acetylmuramic acid 6-phosphate etherase [Verrucomicrobiota bacterium]